MDTKRTINELESILGSKRGNKETELKKIEKIHSIYTKVTKYIDPLTINCIIDTAILADNAYRIYDIRQFKSYGG